VALHPLGNPRPVLSCWPKKDWTKNGLSYTYHAYRRNALSKLAYSMPGAVLPVTRYASPVTAPCAPNAQTVEIAKG